MSTLPAAMAALRSVVDSPDDSPVHTLGGAELISDDSIRYEELFDDSGIGGVTFDPSDYASDEEMMASVERWLTNRWAETPDEHAP